MKVISGGYFLVSSTKRADYMDQTLLPETILSASECVCDYYPDVNIMWSGSLKKKQKYAKELNLSSDTFEEMEKWMEKNFDDKTFLYPQLFKTIDLAREFHKMFLSQTKANITILGIGLPENFVEEFLDEEETHTKPIDERYGIEILLLNKTKIDLAESKMKGYEVLGFEFGKFHSYICNSLEKDYQERFNFSLNEEGFISSLEQAIQYCNYSNSELAGTEPVLWLPWAIYEYRL